MRTRPRRIAVALLCVLAQLALGASTLGLVVCTGRDHAAIELASQKASDACCTGHGHSDADAGGPAFGDSCCSDTPLFASDRRVSDVPRSHAAPAPVYSAWLALAAGPPSLGSLRLRAADPASPASDRLALRAIVLRV